MAKILLTILALLIVIAAIGFAYFAFVDTPPPGGKIERVIPDSRLPKE
jgi:hypothetical protein